VAEHRITRMLRMAARQHGTDWIVFEDVNGAMAMLARQLRDAPARSLALGVVMDLQYACEQYLRKGVG